MPCVPTSEPESSNESATPSNGPLRRGIESDRAWSVHVRADGESDDLWPANARELTYGRTSGLGVTADLYARKYELRFLVTAPDAFVASRTALAAWEELISDLALPDWSVSNLTISSVVDVAATKPFRPRD